MCLLGKGTGEGRASPCLMYLLVVGAGTWNAGITSSFGSSRARGWDDAKGLGLAPLGHLGCAFQGASSCL